MSDPHKIIPETWEVTFSPVRYPYTYCADHLRGQIETSTSRADMARLKAVIAQIIGMDEYDLACKIADRHLEERGIKKPDDVQLT
jgi:hypothetical protein